MVKRPINVAIPRDVHQRLKLAAVNRGLLVREAIEQAADQWAGNAAELSSEIGKNLGAASAQKKKSS